MSISKADGHSISRCPSSVTPAMHSKEGMKKKCESCLLRMIQYPLSTSNKSKGQWYWLHCLWPSLTLSRILHLIGFLHAIDHDSYEACYWDSASNSTLPLALAADKDVFMHRCHFFFLFFLFFNLRQLRTQLAEVYDDTCDRELAWLANMWWQLGHKVI